MYRYCNRCFPCHAAIQLAADVVLITLSLMLSMLPRCGWCYQ